MAKESNENRIEITLFDKSTVANMIGFMYTGKYDTNFGSRHKRVGKLALKDELLQHVKNHNIAVYYYIPELGDLANSFITLPPELDNVDDILSAAREIYKAEDTWMCEDMFIEKCVNNMDLFIERKKLAALQSINPLFEDVIKVFGERLRTFKPLLVDLKKTNIDNVSEKICRKLLRDIRNAWNINYHDI